MRVVETIPTQNFPKIVFKHLNFLDLSPIVACVCASFWLKVPVFLKNFEPYFIRVLGTISLTHLKFSQLELNILEKARSPFLILTYQWCVSVHLKNKYVIVMAFKVIHCIPRYKDGNDIFKTFLLKSMPETA